MRGIHAGKLCVFALVMGWGCAYAQSAPQSCTEEVTIEITVRDRKINGTPWDFGFLNFVKPDPKVLLTPVGSECPGASTEPIILPRSRSDSCVVDGHPSAGLFCRDTLNLHFERVVLPHGPLHVFLMDVDVEEHDLIFEHRPDLHSHEYRIEEPGMHRGDQDSCPWSGGPMICSLVAHGVEMARIKICPPGGCQAPCGDETLPSGYDVNDPDYHSYTITHEICQMAADRACTVENVFQIFLQNPAAVAPVRLTETPQRIESCGTVLLATAPAYAAGYDNRIKTVLDANEHSVTNITLPNHMFYPGQVNRQILAENGAVVIRTIGIGTDKGLMKEVNITTAPTVWMICDDILKEKVRERLTGIPPP